MIHPLILALAQRPGLILEHVCAYADLASAQVLDWGQSLRQRALMALGALLLTLLALGLAGAAGLMLAVIPWEAMPYPWLLVAIPALPLLLGALLTWRLYRMRRPDAFTELREQAAIDLATLHLLDLE